MHMLLRAAGWLLGLLACVLLGLAPAAAQVDPNVTGRPAVRTLGGYEAVPLWQGAEAKAATAAQIGSNSVTRLLQTARRGIDPIGNVMATPPAITMGADWASSTIITTATAAAAGGYRFDALDRRYFTPLGTATKAGDYGGQTNTYSLNPTTVRGGHGWGYAFETFASVADLCVRMGTQQWTVYVTDLTTGVRARVQADDFVGTSNAVFYAKLDFGTRSYRRIEVYPGSLGLLYGVNVPATDTIFAANYADAPRLGIIWDSYGAGTISDTGTINAAKLAFTDYLFARFGSGNGWNFSLGSTGVIANANGASTSYAQRQAAGDFKWTKVGHLDLVIVPGSINDQSVGAGGTANDATIQAAYQAFIAALMADQPRAIIVGTGPENVGGTAQSRFDAYKAGFLAAAGNDPRMIWVDISPAGEELMPASMRTVITGPDGVHDNKLGVVYHPNAMATSILRAIANRFGL